MRRVVGLLIAAAFALAPGVAQAATNATYFNDASLPAADPYVLHDPSTGYYYAYSTDGADPGSYFGIYRSADLVTWEHVKGGALPVNDPKQWGNDWFWAPEVYRNPEDRAVLPVLRRPLGRQREGLVRLRELRGALQGRRRRVPLAGRAVSQHRCPPARLQPVRPGLPRCEPPDGAGPEEAAGHAARRARRRRSGPTSRTSIPTCTSRSDGAQYLYFSRNAYRNWNWDADLGKYIEESNILAVPLTRAWWEDPTGRTMPSIAPAYRGANASKGGPSGPRRDGWVQILSYQQDKQAWENAHVNDYTLSGGEKKDRRWEEGSTTFKLGGAYYLTYSANNWESPSYGVGYATARSPLGPFKKYAGNPILQQDPAIGMYSTGHGSLAFSPDRSEMYYVHHGRPTPDADQRRLYTERMTRPGGVLDIDQSTSDRPVPSGVAPYSDEGERTIAAPARRQDGAAALAGDERRRGEPGAREPAQPRVGDRRQPANR